MEGEWYRAIIVSALSLSLRDKDRLRDREIERAWEFKLAIATHVPLMVENAAK